MTAASAARAARAAGAATTTVGLTRAHVTGPAQEAVPSLVSHLRDGLGDTSAGAVLYFASSHYDPTHLVGPLAAAFPDAAVIGCSTAGEFTDEITSTGGISAVALPHGVLSGAVATLGDLSGDVGAGVTAAIGQIEASLQVPLRELDPAEHLGFVLMDGMHRAEEEVNDYLGDHAPLLDIVGGSAGDDLAFQRTWVSAGSEFSYQGMALMICRVEVPFRIVKTCSFTSTGITLRITEADVPSRTVLRFDDRPAVEAYAEAVGVPVASVDTAVMMRHPLGQMINGEPWIRSPQALVAGGGIRFYAQILPGMEVEVMEATDLVAETRAALHEAHRALRGYVSGGVMFNCILRRLEMDATGTAQPFLEAFGGLPLAGFHTYGETWMAHVNQTLTGVVFG